MYRNTLAALVLVGSTGMAPAHSTLEQKEAAISATTKITLRVPHGCDGEATHTVRLELPEGVYAAKPMPKAGWDLTTVTAPYATPYDNHGTEMTQGVRQIVWSGGKLEDGWYDEFTFRADIGPDLSPGKTLYFPALQECATGTADWTDTSGARDVPNPAPHLTLVATASDDGDHGVKGAAGAPVRIGGLTISGAFSRATLPNAPVAGGFLSVTNTGDRDDRLVAAASDVAGRIEVHEMAMDGDVMRMRELTDGLPIPAGATVDLKPGGYHIMFMDLHDALVEGETVDVTLTFENAGDVAISLAVGAPNARAAGNHGHAEVSQ